MELAGLKLWQALIALLLAWNSFDPASGAPGFVGALLGSWVLLVLVRAGVGWLQNRASASPAP